MKFDIESTFTVGLASFDSGGAEILSSMMLNSNCEKRFFVDGPAQKTYLKRFQEITFENLEADFSGLDLLISSTSWQSDLGYNSIKKAKELDIPTVVILDHWIYFKDRFEREGITILPDQIWVVDEMAKAEVNNIFPDVPVYLVENYFFKEIKAELDSFNIKSTGEKVLYVCEPISEHAELRYGNPRQWNYTELEALDYFFSHFEKLGLTGKKVKIRPHPSENEAKYNEVVGKYDLPIEISKTSSLMEDISESDVIVGCESMAMVIGLLADKKVFSSIPPGGRECVLPHLEIQKIKNIVGDS